MQSRTTSQNGQVARPLRADAQRNYDLLVAAADAAFTEHGASASLEDIARRAGVGIGTLYRHFPTREALLAKVLDDSNAAMVARAAELEACASPTEALSAWLHAMLTHSTTYSGLSKSLAAGLAQTCSELRTSCQALSSAGTQLLARAKEAGEIRADARIDDLVMAVHAAAWASEQTGDPSGAPRLIKMVLDGLRIAPKTAPARARRPAARKPARRG